MEQPIRSAKSSFPFSVMCSRASVILCLALAWGSPTAEASDLVTIDVSTGVLPDGTLPSVGSNDDTYVLVAGPAGTGAYPAPAIVVDPHPAWATFPGTRWVSRNLSKTGPNGQRGSPNFGQLAKVAPTTRG